MASKLGSVHELSPLSQNAGRLAMLHKAPKPAITSCYSGTDFGVFMTELHSRLQRAIDDLEVIKKKLEFAAAPASKSGAKELIVNDSETMGQLRDLKTLVDHMR